MADNDLTFAVQHLIATGEAERLAHVFGEAVAKAPPTRDQLAAMAMQGWLASFQGIECSDVAGVARFAYEVADAMLKERERGR